MSLHVLDWLYERTRGHEDQYVAVNAERLISPFSFLRRQEAIEKLRLVIDRLARDRLLRYTHLRNAQVQELPSQLGLTRTGVETVESLRRRREDPALRMTALRDALLRWAYEAKTRGESEIATMNFGLSDYGRFLNAGVDRFRIHEVEAASSWLERHGFVALNRGASGKTMTLALTQLGEQQVESGLSASEKEMTTGNINVTHVTNSPGVVISNQSPYASQTVTVTISGEGQQAVRKVAGYLEQAAGLLGVPAKELERIPTLVAELRSAAVEPKAEPHRLRALLDTVRQLALSAAADGPLAHGLDALVQQALRALGL